MLSRIILCLLAVVLFTVDVIAQEKLQATLLSQEEKLIEAINKKDKATIAKLMADEAMSITSRGRQTTVEIIRSLEKISFSLYKISDPKTITVSADAAILTYSFSWTGENERKPIATMNVYATSVWRQENGNWRSVFYQETPIGKP